MGRFREASRIYACPTFDTFIFIFIFSQPSFKVSRLFEINMISIDSINLQERLQQQGPDRLDGAASSYQTFFKRFAAFLNAPIYHKN